MTQEVTTHKKRVFGYDLIRAVAIILVMIDHGVGSDITPLANRLIKSLVSPDAVLFFMLSGALLMPVKGNWGSFLAKRFKRVMIPFLFWSILFFVCLHLEGTIDASTMWYRIRWSWATPFYGSAWFIFVILSCYLMMPFASVLLERVTRRQLEYFMFLWICGGTVIWMQAYMAMNYDYNIMTLFLPLFGYCIAGFYLARYPIDAPAEAPDGDNSLISRFMGWVDCHRKLLIIAAGVLSVALAIYYCFFPKIYIMNLLGSNYSFTTYLWGFLIFAVLMKVKTLGRVGNWIVRLYSRNAFGIYLIHQPLAEEVFRHYFPEFEDTTWMILVLLTLPLLLSELTRRIPIIGTKD